MKKQNREAYCSLKRSEKRYYSYFVTSLRKENNRLLLFPDSFFAHRQFQNGTNFCAVLERSIIDLITLGTRLVELQRLELETSIFVNVQ